MRKPSNKNQRQAGEKPSMPKWAIWALVAVAAALIIGPRLWPTTTATQVTYTEFLDLVDNGEVQSVTINNLSNVISGELRDGSTFETTGATALSDAESPGSGVRSSRGTLRWVWI